MIWNKTPTIYIILIMMLTLSNCINGKFGMDGYCETHKTKMKTAIVGVAYGLPIYYDEQQNKYPNRKQSVPGGCVVGIEKFGVTYVCKTCNQGYKRNKKGSR